MDPLSQAVAGSLFAQAGSRSRHLKSAMVIGAMAGVAPDLDILIRSSSDPLLGLMMHRHFTHSLLFAPIGGLLIALLVWLVYRRLPFALVYLSAALGWFSHGLLDVLTSYGTHLTWPLSEQRLALDWVSIIDPLVTLPVLLMVVIAAFRRSKRWVVAGFAWALIYFALGAYQHHRALTIQETLAEQRGHQMEKARVFPYVGSLLLWRSAYLSEGQYFVDDMRLGIRSEDYWYPGGQISAYTLMAEEGSVLLKDLHRFELFTDGYLGLVSQGQYWIVGDVRYGIPLSQGQMFWGIRFNPHNPDSHARMINLPAMASRDLDGLWSLIKGEVCQAPECVVLENH